MAREKIYRIIFRLTAIPLFVFVLDLFTTLFFEAPLMSQPISYLNDLAYDGPIDIDIYGWIFGVIFSLQPLALINSLFAFKAFKSLRMRALIVLHLFVLCSFAGMIFNHGRFLAFHLF